MTILTFVRNSFTDIFQEAGLPLWLRPYEVLVTSSHTALIETIYDTVSTFLGLRADDMVIG